jgi:hypothetical protein
MTEDKLLAYIRELRSYVYWGRDLAQQVIDENCEGSGDSHDAISYLESSRGVLRRGPRLPKETE